MQRQTAREAGSQQERDGEWGSEWFRGAGAGGERWRRNCQEIPSVASPDQDDERGRRDGAASGASRSAGDSEVAAGNEIFASLFL